MIRPALLAALAAASLCALTTPALSQTATGVSGLKIVARIAGPDGKWDYASFDAGRRRVYVTHGQTVMTIDADTGKADPSFAAGDHLHSVAVVPGAAVVVSTNSGDSSARVLDGASGKLVTSIPTAKDTDGAVYDPSSGQVLVICGDSGEITLVDPKTRTSPGAITVGDALEFGAVDGKGKFFVNLVEKDAVAVVDVAARKVLARYPMPGCAKPTGIAYVEGERLVVACAMGAAKILNAKTGAEIASFKIGGFADSVLYDPDRHLAYIPSALSGTLAVIALSGPHDNTIVDTVVTQMGARTGAVDPKTGRIYLPTAEYNLPAPASQRPTTKPGTFEVLVLDRR